MAYKNIILTPSNVSSQVAVQKSQFYKGFSTANTNALSNKIFDYDLIKQDMLNQFQTRKGERLMNPNFGTIIWDMIFEPFTDDVKQQISDDVTRILNYDPRVVPTAITIVEADSGLLIDATLYYVQINLTDQIKLSFNSEIGIAALQ